MRGSNPQHSKLRWLRVKKPRNVERPALNYNSVEQHILCLRMRRESEMRDAGRPLIRGRKDSLSPSSTVQPVGLALTPKAKSPNFWQFSYFYSVIQGLQYASMASGCTEINLQLFQLEHFRPLSLLLPPSSNLKSNSYISPAHCTMPRPARSFKTSRALCPERQT